MMGKLALLGIAFAISLAGCDDSTQRSAKVRPPAPPPKPAIQAEQLPLTIRPPVAHLNTKPRPAIDLLIDSVEASYESGKKDYQAGNIVKARQDFDHATDLIMASGFAVDSDPRLAELFDHIADTIHGYEAQARESAQAEGEAGDEQGVAEGEPAPIEEIADMELPTTVAPGLAAMAEQELMAVPHDIPLTLNESVLSYLAYFQTARGQATVENGLRRSGRYREMIRRVLRQEGMPQDLIYLAQAESAFLPRAVSRAGARGIWQFMPFRGQEYDLDRNFWIDERSDPEKSTRAAARHLRDLYQMFGDWYLVMAAYNSGPMNVIKGIQRTGYADFWELYKRNALPKETKNYVPIILALAMVAKEPARYGIHVTPEAPPKTDTLKPGHSLDLRLAADSIDVDLETLRALNPILVRLVTPDDSNFELHLPPGTRAKFVTQMAAVPADKWTIWRLHLVESGETLAEVGRHYHLTPKAIAGANNLDAHDPLSVGAKIIIPTDPAAAKLVRYRVQKGDTLEGIAARYDCSVEELKRWNSLRTNRAPRGARLKIYPGGVIPSPRRSANKESKEAEPKLKATSSKDSGKGEARHYRVKPGETLFSIAQAFRTTVAALRKWNPSLAGRPLEAGDLLTIWPAH
jgi:membrane-bound lytic murein transglycosylase D